MVMKLIVHPFVVYYAIVSLFSSFSMFEKKKKKVVVTSSRCSSTIFYLCDTFSLWSVINYLFLVQKDHMAI